MFENVIYLTYIKVLLHLFQPNYLIVPRKSSDRNSRETIQEHRRESMDFGGDHSATPSSHNYSTQ